MNRLAAPICKLLKDPNKQVRFYALSILIELYKQVGDKLRDDLLQDEDIPIDRLRALFDRFDEIKKSKAASTNTTNTNRLSSSHNNQEPKQLLARFINLHVLTAAAVMDQNLIEMFLGPVSSGANNFTGFQMNFVFDNDLGVDRSGRPRNRNSSSIPSGFAFAGQLIPSRRVNKEVVESEDVPTSRPDSPDISRRPPKCVEAEMFWSAIDQVHATSFPSFRDLRFHFENIKEVLSDPENDWEKRSDALRRLRSSIGPMAIQCFQTDYRLANHLQIPLQRTLRDLRSQVIREACITVAFMSYKLGDQPCGFDLLAETLVSPLLALIQNSAKVMANSAICAMCFIIQYTESSRLLNPILGGLSSKSKDIRRFTCELIHRILSTWQPNTLTRYSPQLQEAIRAGIEDADMDARMHSRNAFALFKQYFPAQADSLFNSLDGTKRKILKDGSDGTATPTRRCITPGLSNSRLRGRAITPKPINSMVRSKTPCAGRTTTTTNNFLKNAQISSVSQPASRTNSPFRMKRCKTPASSTTNHQKSIPIHPTKSRDVSPLGRTNTLKFNRNRKIGDDAVGVSETSSVASDRSTGRKKFSADKAGGGGGSRTPAGRNTPFSSGEPQKIKSDQTNSNEMLGLMASSAWTDKFEGLLILQRFIDSAVRLAAPENNGISSSEKVLNRTEIRRTCDQLVKMFSDAHGKVYNLFLDVLFDFIGMYNTHIIEWLYPLISGLISKQSNDSAVSPQSSQKVQSCLDLIRKRFPLDKQFLSAMQLLSVDDNPSIKMKMSILRFLDQLLGDMQSADIPPGTIPEMLLGTAAIIRMTADRKSSELRKSSQRVLFSFAQMNNAEFMTILSKLPREFRVAASSYVMDSRSRPNCMNFDKSLDDAFQQCNATLRKSIKRATTPICPNENGTPVGGSQRSKPFVGRSPVPTIYKYATISTTLPRNGAFPSISKIPRRPQTRCDFSLPPQSSNASSSGGSHSGTNGQTTIASSTNAVDGLANEFDAKLSLRSGGSSSSSSTGLKHANLTVAASNQSHPSAFTPQTSEEPKKRLVTTADHIGIIGSIVYQISRQDNPVESRYHHMQCLLSMISSDASNSSWTLHFDNVLFLILRVLFEPYILLQTIALKILQWMLKHQPQKFDNCNELTVVRLLEFQRDRLAANSLSVDSQPSTTLLVGSIPTQADLIHALDETITAAAISLPLEECFQVLRPIIETSESVTMTLSAIRMLEIMIDQRMSKSDAMTIIDPLVSSLLIAWSNENSSVRKAAVFCLVSLHKLVGPEAMNPHLVDLPPSKLKLLNVYITRAITSHETTLVGNGHTTNGVNGSSRLLAN